MPRLLILLFVLQATLGVTSAMSKPKLTDAELRAKLSPTQYQVACQGSTEPPFQNAYWNNHDAGIYVDVISGEALFSSLDKFDSGTGWPSFTKPLRTEEIVQKSDDSLGMHRTEVRSKTGDAHLGHVFNDGPKEAGGMRYCINSASLKFIPVADLEKAGYGKYRALFEKGAKPVTETAVLAGGCFWGMEEILRKVPGVLSTRVGYSGGLSNNPTYTDVKKGDTGHAESVEIVFDPTKITYAELLEKWFFHMHDPTTLNRQGNDVGSQYRSAIFFQNETQKKVAEEVKRKVGASGLWKKPIVTEISAASKFYPAEEYHQDYLQKNPGGYTCHYMR